MPDKLEVFFRILERSMDRLESMSILLTAVEAGSLSAAVHARLVVNTAEAAIDAAIAGLGVTHVLSYQVADAVKADILGVVLEEFEPAPSPVSLVYSGQRRLPLKLRAFLDFAAPRLKARLLKAVM
jgi:DNA-binding transcriptional LysR family regulator